MSIKIGDHVKHEHKYRLSWGVVRALTTGLFGEPRALIDWVSCSGSRFPVCIDSLQPDSDGVVAGVLKAAKHYS